MWPDSTTVTTSAPAPAGVFVSILVPNDHPFLQLKERLDWEAIRKTMCDYWRQAGKNVDGKRGRPWPVDLYVPLLVYKRVRQQHARLLEADLRENAVARLFVGVAEQQWPQVRDHSNIDRAEAALGEAGWKAVNELIVRQAASLGFADPTILSSDTTAQEPAIGYPHEAGILNGIAQRVYRSLVKIQETVTEKVVPGLAEAKEKAREIFRQVKEYHLFTKGKEAKDRVVLELVKQARELIGHSEEVIREVAKNGARKVQSGVQKMREMVEVTQTLLPQILKWINTGFVATGKILHAGISEARSIVRNKAGKKVEFGFKWLINRLEGGYVFGRAVAAQASEYQMPIEALKDYRGIFGKDKAPELQVYDRGGSSAKTVEKLSKEGVKKVGIMPKGAQEWSIAAEDQAEVRSQRGKTEGVIGTLKSQKCGFNQRRERSSAGVKAAGQRALVCLNLARLMKDICGKAKQSEMAEV